MHSWICKYHKAENQVKLEKFRKDYSEKFKLKFVVAVSTGQFREQQDSLQQEQEEQPLVSAISAIESPIVQEVSVQNANYIDKSLAEASKVIKKRLWSNGFKGEIHSVPEGDPMFLFFRAKGRVNGVNTFFDSGCSTAVFKEGIPGTELRAKIIQTGPFMMNGVGGIKTKANNLWLCSMDLANGDKQFIQGLSVDKVTSDFPMVNLNAAIEEVKAADENNTALQSCKIPDLAGGSTDLLLGIMYNSIHPTIIH